MIDPLSKRFLHDAGTHGPVMLMYHAVVPGRGTPAWPWAVSLERFRLQLAVLEDAGWQTPTMNELVANPATYNQRTAVITFDDGYIDNLAACEVLQGKGQRASWFIVAGSIGAAPAWPGDGRPAGRLLNGAELRQMQAAGMEIGSHTVSHSRLPTLSDVLLHREVNDSKRALEDVLGQAVTSFAYPYGEWDNRCADAVKQAGYMAACTTRTGWALRDGDPYRIRRLTVFNHDTPASFARKLYFGSHDVRWRDIARYALRRLGV